jgi:hypothetical protein
MSLVRTELTPKTFADDLRDIRELATHPGWTQGMRPFLADLEREHTEAAINPKIAPASRAEHIHAIHALREALAFPQNKLKELEASWKQSQRKPPSA